MINTTQTRERKQRGIGSMLENLSGRKMGEDESIALAPTIEDSPFPNENLFQILNRLIGRGISFDTSENDFIVCREDLLTAVERKFIEVNQPTILCTLQQSLLTKYIFACD